MLDPNEAAFLRSIAEEGEVGTARLVFADWLEEHGDTPRAEFIRVQCELAAGKLSEERRLALRLRERELLNVHWGAWCASCGMPVEDVHFERGLISRVRLSRREGESVPGPAWARLAALTELDLSGLRLGDRGLAAFLETAHLPALRKLILSDNDITDAGAAALAAATGLPRLDSIYLFQNPVSYRARVALEESSGFLLADLDLGEPVEGYCMSPGQADVARRQYIRTELLPVVSRYFSTYERLQSAMLCVAQYWADEANDAVHGTLIVSELLEPTLEGVGEWADDAPRSDPNVPK